MKDNITLINKVLEKIPNKYMAMIVAAKRAKELNRGIKPLIKSDAVKPTTIALYEIANGFIKPGLDKISKEMLLPNTDKNDSLPSPELVVNDLINEAEDIELSQVTEYADEDFDDESDGFSLDDIDIDASEDVNIDIFEDEDIREDDDL